MTPKNQKQNNPKNQEELTNLEKKYGKEPKIDPKTLWNWH